ncbi:MAG TPA: VOC family protein [Vicinamibacterales bacterium]|nr:VOC family protein [Vicinamibacterales bacterium]
MRTFITLAFGTLVGASLLAQAPPPNPNNKTGVIGLMHAIHSTNDVEKTLVFYQQVFALNGQVRGFDPKGPRILTNSPTASLRVAMMNLTGHTGPSAMNFELTQFGDLPRQENKRPDIRDPGAPMMKWLVRDLDTVVANVKRVGAPIVTRGGAPVTVMTPIGSAKAIIVRDPDGYFIEAIQATPAIIAATDAEPTPGRGRGRGPDANAAPAAPPPPSQVVGEVIGLTVRDMSETLKYWNGVLGMDMPQPTKWEKDQAMLDLLGLPKGAEYRLSSGVVSGSPAKIEFMEVKGISRKPFDLRVTDAMACGAAIRVGHIRDVLAKIKASGGRVMSKDEALVDWSDTIRNVFVKDPNGMNLELVGAADPNL